MFENEFDTRIKVSQIIENQIPDFILTENQYFTEFLKQYYISQEYQSSPSDIVENLDQYIKLDNLIPDVISKEYFLDVDVFELDNQIFVNSTSGFPDSYGLLKIDDEIISYTGITTNSFTGCIRGFSGVTSYKEDGNQTSLVFSKTEITSHKKNSVVENLSVLFLKEFYKKLKAYFLPGLEGTEFTSELNVGNFIKESKSFYKSKGSEESFRILFNVLFGETPKILNLDDYTIKSSSAEYSRRLIVVSDVISGDPLQLKGQTLYKNNTPDTSASISEVEVIQRKNKTYYKLLLFLGYDDSYPTVTGTFNITGNTKNIDSVSIGSSIITVDSTIGFPKSGKVYSGNNVITYTDKTVNQFLNCSGVTSEIKSASLIYSDETYYGYENGDETKKVVLRITGVLSNYKEIFTDSPIGINDKITVKNIGELIKNPVLNPTRKETFANSWIYNTSSRYQIVDITSGGLTSQITLKSDIDKSSLKVGDYIDILYRNSQDIVASNLKVTSITGKQVSTNQAFNLSANILYDVRRRLNFATSSIVPLEFSNLTADIQNVYNDSDKNFYVSSNSLPSYPITSPIFSYNAFALSGLLSDGRYSIVEFATKVSFINGSEIYYSPVQSPISGLSEGVYYVEVLPGNQKIRLYSSKEVVGTSNYLKFGPVLSGTHKFTLNSQKPGKISPQKILRKFPLNVNLGDGTSDLTSPGSIGQLINGVEILNYKCSDKIYYGPLESVDILNRGENYDVINPPELSISSGSAKIQPVVSGSIHKVYVKPQDFDIDVIVSIACSGGNGRGATFSPVIETRRREIEFDARQLSDGGGLDISNETITFMTNHGLNDGEEIIYRPGDNLPLGIGTFGGLNSNSGKTLKTGTLYYTKYISDKTIQLYQSISDYRSGINTVGFTTISTSGIHKFATQPKNTLTQIKVLNGGQNYTNRKLRVKSSGISTEKDTITFKNHGFNDGELVVYSNTNNPISGLSTVNQYYISKVDDNRFKLSDAGIAGTIRSNYERGNHVSLGSTGSGYHIFNYTPITISVQYSAVGLGSTQYRGNIIATPVVRGSIVDAYVYEGGSDYGSTILNYHKKPSIIVKDGKSAQLSPVIVNGRIESVSVLYGGAEYYSTPDLIVSGDGVGAILHPVITNNKISSVIVVNSGYGYKENNTNIQIKSTGKNAIFDAQVRSLDVNQNVIFNDVNNPTTTESSEIIITTENNLQYFVSEYSSKIQSSFGDTGSTHSPIIGWAYDGNPIYGSYGYANPNNTNTFKQLASGYTLDIDNIENRPSGFSAGFFIDDYVFTNSGDLDQYNGRFCITPEFPNGVYAYFATSKENPLSSGDVIGAFPYFIGPNYRSKFVFENKTLNQDFDFNNSDLVRNTYPYKIADEYADNDFISESNEVVNQVSVVESVTTGSIENFEVVSSGNNYKIGDALIFDETSSDSGGIIAQVSEINGKNIVSLNTTVETYNGVVLTWKNGSEVEVKVSPSHTLQNLDYINVSGLSTTLSELNGSYEIGVTSYRSVLTKSLPSSGLVTDIYVSYIPNISIGSSIGIGTETLTVLNVYSNQNVIRVSRSLTGTSHSETSLVNYIPDSFIINKNTEYFESKDNDLVYFNPKYSVGVGTTSGVGVGVSFNIGIQTNNTISVPTQSIYLPNHPFKTNQEITLTKPSTASSILVALTPERTFNRVGILSAGSNVSTSDRFGQSVAMSSDGTTIAVGAPLDDVGGSDVGNVYVFDRIGSTFTQVGILSAGSNSGNDYQFGYSVAMSSDGTSIVVGEPDPYLFDARENGYAYVFDRVGDTFTQVGILSSSYPTPYDRFGHSVAMSSDGTTIAVGVPNGDFSDIEAGDVYVFDRTGNTFNVVGILSSGTNVNYDGTFGQSVAMSSDGTTIAVGAPSDDVGGSNVGNVYVFDRVGSTFNQVGILSAGSNVTANDYFGESVTMSSDGSTIAVGAIFDDVGGYNVGNVYVFDRVGSTFNQVGILSAGSNVNLADYFGQSIAMSSDGTTIAVGAPFDDIGGNNSGSAYIFSRVGSTFNQVGILSAGSNVSISDFFGQSVTMSSDGTTIAVGAPVDDVGGSDVGNLYVFDYPELYMNLPSSGNSQNVYVIKKSPDHIGIVTQIGLTTTSNGIYFIDNGSDDYRYNFESNYTQVTGNINKVSSLVSVSTSHNLVSGDSITLNVKPNLSVGIGTSTSIKVQRDTLTGYTLINSIGFNSTGINTSTNRITISNHKFKTGDKVKYSADNVASGLTTGYYYIYEVDNNTIQLCKTYKDSIQTNSPNIVSIASTGGSTQTLSLVNPPLSIIKNNDLVFDLSDSSLNGYDFKIFYDSDFTDEFVSTGSTSSFTVSGVGTIGVSTNASLTINYSDKIPDYLYYSLEKTGIVIEPDKDVVNYSQINYSNSAYNGTYKISGVGDTSFKVSLKTAPEKNSYIQSECDRLNYTTNSTTASGGISKIRTISPGFNFKSLPILSEITTDNGTGAYIKPISSTIGKIKELRIVNEGFEYSSDKTLKPQASIAKFAVIQDSNTINKINVTDGGKYYINSPDLVIINTDTGEKIDSGLLIANVKQSKIESVTIESEPKGLPSTPVTIKSINNTNGIQVQKIESSTSGIVTCTIVTPVTGFSIEPFANGDKIFVEGIQKYGNDGDGFNSKDYSYEFFTVSNYNSSVNPRKFEYNLSGLTTNPGIANTSTVTFGNIVNFNNYPKFIVTQKFSNFIVGELLEVKTELGYIKTELRVVESNENYIKYSGEYELLKLDVIRGVQSGSIATINEIKQSSGFFNVDFASEQRIGWLNDTGKLDEDTQVIQDNDYYQNLSYSIKSRQQWNDIVSPVNSIVHPSGMKNFADTEIIDKVKTGINSIDSSISRYDLIEENRVDTINNFDLVLDYDNFEYSSRQLKLKNKKLADYIECRTNRVLKIDDISPYFSTLDQTISESSKIVDIDSSRKFNRYLVQISSKDFTTTQFNELIVIHNLNDIATLEKGSVCTGISSETGYESNLIGNLSAYEDNIGKKYLQFEPKDTLSTTYNIKYLNTTFGNSIPGIGTTSIGFVNLIGNTLSISTGQTKTLVSSPITTLKSVHSQVFLTDNISGDINYIELFVDHDGVNTNVAEFYFDIGDGLSYGFIGSFGASISNGILSLDYTNDSSNSVTVQSRNVGFGTTAVGIGTYRFKKSGQLDEYENTVKYETNYSNVSSASTITQFDTTKYTSIKSTIRVGIGQTSALHQIMMISDNSNVYTTQYPFLSVDSTSGIGTFGGELNGNIASLKFYPDPSVTGQIELLSFNEIFFKETDYVNTPPSFEYNNIVESIGVSKYYAFNDSDLNRLSFDLNYNNSPIFMKTFDPSNLNILDKSTGIFTIENHFFSTGEELIYRPNSTFVGVAASSVGIGTTTLPQSVYAIKVTNNTFKLALTKSDALSGTAVTFTSSGLGNSHELEMVKKNEKSIVTINNIIQSPLAYSLINHNVSNGGQIGAASSIFGLSGISSIVLGDILKIDDEYMKVNNVGLGTTYSGPISFAGTFPLVEVTRGFVGTSATTHPDSSSVSVYRGSYNIKKNQIHFVDAPEGSIEDQLFEDYDNLPEPRATFDGRVFLRDDYTENKVYDNMSEKFTGIGQTYTLTVGGANTVGLGTSGGNGIVIINGIYQTPSTQNNPNNNFRIIENTSVGISSIVFSGITSTNGSIVISESDVNQNQLPRGGMIVSLGSTPGLGYAPLVGASVTAIIGAGGSITSIGIGSTGTWGSGYRNPVSITITEFGHSGVGATISATVGAGGTLSFNILGGGSGYTNPTINISPPSYSNLPVIGVSRPGIGTTTDCGTGLLVNVEVGASSTTGIGSTLFEVSNFKISRNGYGFKSGDVIKLVGLVTAYGLTQPINEFELTVLETFTDSFSAWQFGELDYIDSIQTMQDGNRKRFPLYYKSQLLSFEKDSSNSDSQLIEFSNLLLIFVNGVIQKPGESYQFDGGTSFIFTVAPKVTDNVSIYFYRGSATDSVLVNVDSTIKSGDSVQVFSNNLSLSNTITQEPRIITDIKSSDIVATNLYTLQGIDNLNYKPINWTKQKVDTIIDGYPVSKARDSIETQIYPTAKIIKNLTSSDTELFVDDAQFFNYENLSPGSIEFDAIIVSIGASSVETINNATTISGFSGNITGITTSVGIGTDLAIVFTMDSTLSPFTGISTGNPIYIYDTKVGNGVTTPSGIGVTFLDNIYEISAFNSSVGIITCNVSPTTNTVGIATTGSSVGKFSWGKISGFTRASNPITLNINDYTSSSGLSTYPIIQRRGYGLRNNGAI